MASTDSDNQPITVTLVHVVSADSSGWNGVCERLIDAVGDSRDSVLNEALVPHQYPTGSGIETAVELSIDAAKFHDAFAADLPPKLSAIMAATRRPVAELAFSEKSGVPAWKNLSAWTVVASGDTVAGADVIRSMAERAGSRGAT